MKKRIVQMVGLVGLLTMLNCVKAETQSCFEEVPSGSLKDFVKNHYVGKDGGYVLVYWWWPEHRVSDKGMIVGLIRVKGKYYGDKFVPLGHRLGDDISKDPKLKKLAKLYFPNYKYPWFGGDTGKYRKCPWFFKN